MENYFRWSLRQLYLIAFLPTRFRREVEETQAAHLKLGYVERLAYVGRMLPWMVALAVLGNVAAGRACDAFGLSYNWKFSWLGVATGLVAGIAFALVAGAAASIAAGTAGGVVVGNVAGVAVGSLIGVWVYLLIGIVIGIPGGIVFGFLLSRTLNALLKSAPRKSENIKRLALIVLLTGVCGLTLSITVIVPIAGSAVPINEANGIAVSAGTALVAGVVSGVVSSAVFGMAGGPSFGWLFGLTMGVAGSLAFGLSGAVIFSADLGRVVGLAFGLAFPLSFWLLYFRLVLYPFEVALSAAAYFVARGRPVLTRQAWRFCPVTWNEVIWLPLPFAGKLLALLARSNRDEGLRQIAFVAAERPLQRRAALAALVELAVSDLRADSLASLSDVAERLNWTTDSSAELPGELRATLPRFDRAAQHVAQYLTLNSPYRKGEALARAAAEVEGLQRSLIVARGRYAPRLLQVANEWRGLLGEESGRAKALAEAGREIPNPFVFGNPVAETEENVFTGRRDIVKQIEASVLGAEQAPTLLLHGPRRMGKTSILNQLPRLLGPDFAPTVVDCQNPAVTESAATLLRYLSRKLSEGARRRRVAVEPLTAKALEREPFAAFDEWLEGLERAVPAGPPPLLCLDEYERLQATLDAGWGRSFLDALRHILQHRPRVVLMFTGAHTFQELGPAWTDRFISARRVRVSFLTREEVEPLLTRPIPEFDMTYAEGALGALFVATAGQPFLTQATAFELVQLLNEQERREATTEDVEAAQARALESGGEYFANVWSDAGAEGQAVLRAVARGETVPDFPAARAWLREHDVLNEAGEFAVPLVRRWVRERAGV